MKVSLLLLSFLTLHKSSDAFCPQPSHASLTAATATKTGRYTPLYGASDDEIAKLEEQLAQLKAEKSKPADAPASNPEVEIPEGLEMEIMFSERWKEQDGGAAEEGGPGLTTTILGVVGVVLALVLFSQVPIGQEDLSKYSSIKATETSIDLGDLNRARQQSDL